MGGVVQHFAVENHSRVPIKPTWGVPVKGRPRVQNLFIEYERPAHGPPRRVPGLFHFWCRLSRSFRMV